MFPGRLNAIKNRPAKTRTASCGALNTLRISPYYPLESFSLVQCLLTWGVFVSFALRSRRSAPGRSSVFYSEPMSEPPPHFVVRCLLIFVLYCCVLSQMRCFCAWSSFYIYPFLVASEGISKLLQGGSRRLPGDFSWYSQNGFES